MPPDPANQFRALYALSDDALLEETARLAANERMSTAALIAAIAEVDARRLYRQEGFKSTYRYCRQVLKLSEHAAYDRITAAKNVQKFPAILQRLADGTLTLSNLTLLAPFLESHNCEELLLAAENKSKQEVEAIVSALRPKGPIPELYRLELLISREAWEHLLRLQELLLPSIGDGDPSRIVERALALLHANTEARKMAKVEHAQAPKPPSPGSRHVPAGVKREVAARDQNRCAFVGRAGRCTETAGLEFHHIKSFASGGLATVENIEMRCRAHNQYEAELDFGARAIRRTRPGASSAKGAAKLRGP